MFDLADLSLRYLHRELGGDPVDWLRLVDTYKVTSTFSAPTPIRMKARDGTTDLYGLMYVPTNLDQNKKYPIIDYIYPGPQVGSIRSRSFPSQILHGGSPSSC